MMKSVYRGFVHVIRNKVSNYVHFRPWSENMAANQYYRRTLPSSCISLTSEEGKQVFKEAMNNDDMNSFFSLAAQFRTQEEPAYCGLSTLVMVLNALSVDPGRVWKGPWRWYHENMLDCCLPLDVAAKQGITLFQFACLAKCNGLDVDMVQARDSASVGDFRRTIEKMSRCDDQVLVCSYSRAVLDQTGDGHFSPLGGYHTGRDLVLIFDVARFKYPPHWVPTDLLWKAMQGLDQETGLPRGYMILKATSHTGSSTVLFKISSNFDLTSPSSEQKPEMVEFLKQWQAWLATSFDEIYEKNAFYQVLVSKFLTLWCTQNFPDCHQLLTMKIDAKCCGQLSPQHKVAIYELVDSLEKQPLFQIVEKSLRSGEYTVSSCWDNLVSAPPTNGQLCCPWKASNEEALPFNFPDMKLAHLVTIVLLSWPYESSHSAEVSKAMSITHSAMSAQYINQEVTGANSVLQSEVELLKFQLSTMFFYYHAMDSSF